jgi:hypothetical protein
MPQKRISTKKIAIDKAYATVVIAVAAAAFVVVFSLVASKALLDQRAYQSKVIGIKKGALNTLKQNITAADQLSTSYLEFTGATTNVLGGNPQGDADRDGDNARIILDALPSKYDFPALTSSLDKLLRGNGFPPNAITGTDNESLYSGSGTAVNTSATANTPANSTATQSQAGSTPTEGAVEMPFTIGVKASSKKGKELLELFEHSIRPINILSLGIKGNENKLEFNINAVTYFQPERQVNVRTEVVK